MTYRNDIDALSARHAALSAEVETKTRELDTTSRLLDEMKARAKLPVLPNIRVASPCTADWKEMAPVDDVGERVRHCGSCDKNVYNLSQMTRDEAEALILAKEGRLCVRYFQRKDGTILLKDCTVGASNSKKRRLIAAGAAAMLVGSGAAAAFMMRGDATPAATIVQSSDEIPSMRGKIEVAHEDPPPPAPPSAHDNDWHEVKGDIDPGYEMKMGGISFDPLEDNTLSKPD
ncbi:MAG TPA: hypothetical protein VMZ53_30775 [Kofleriaceae bacterium]|nr:hypothetical protein [Kofleriaceae bacterium]